MKLYGCLLSIALLTACSDGDIISKAGGQKIVVDEFENTVKEKVFVMRIYPASCHI